MWNHGRLYHTLRKGQSSYNRHGAAWLHHAQPTRAHPVNTQTRSTQGYQTRTRRAQTTHTHTRVMLIPHIHPTYSGHTRTRHAQTIHAPDTL